MSGKVPYENLVWSGEYSLLLRDSVLIDSVDAAFGVQDLGAMRLEHAGNRIDIADVIIHQQDTLGCALDTMVVCP